LGWGRTHIYYFDELIGQCSKNITGPVADTFTADCWGFLLSLIDKPLCTTRLDSRFVCSGNRTLSPLLHTPGRNSVVSLIHDHFKNNTINIVIIGAGPVGLQLANALLDVKMFNSYSTRIVIFENRVHSPGAKRRYERNWLTDIGIQFFHNVGDPRIYKFFDVLRHPEDPKVHLPIKAIETLLLLSVRERGAKLIYDNVENYEETLASIENLILFDATGNHLNKQRRTDINGEKDGQIIRPWLLPEKKLKRGSYINLDNYKIIQKHHSEFQVGERQTPRGNILYPVSPDGIPYTIPFLKINDIRSDNVITDMELHVSRSNKNICVDSCEVDDDWDCDSWCRTFYDWEIKSEFREDIIETMDKYHPGFSYRVAFFNLSSEQADAFSYLLSKANATGIPASHIPISELAEIPIFKENNLHILLSGLHDQIGTNFPLLSFYEVAPYIFQDVVVPNLVFGENLSCLLIGDSYFTGDPNKSSGLQNHYRMIKDLTLY